MGGNEARRTGSWLRRSCHQQIKGRKTGALKHQWSPERSENGHERCWSHGSGMLKGLFSSPITNCGRHVLLSQLAKAVGPKRQARGLRRPDETLGHYGRTGMYTEYKTSFTHLRSLLVRFTDCLISGRQFGLRCQNISVYLSM